MQRKYKGLEPYNNILSLFLNAGTFNDESRVFFFPPESLYSGPVGVSRCAAEGGDDDEVWIEELEFIC